MRGGPIRTAPRLIAAQQAIVACEGCPRLRRYCAQVALAKKAAHRDEKYWGRPVPGFGDAAARVLIVGLAPAAHGANRTGRVFTGDGSGDFLMRALHANGFATLPTSRHAGDGLELRDAYIAAAVRCAPPDNKPTPAEIARCQPHLEAELAALPRVRVLVALGRIGFDACVRLLRDRGAVFEAKPAFAHAAVALARAGQTRLALVGSYHPSRQNTNTGRLTPVMMEDAFRTARSLLDGRVGL